MRKIGLIIKREYITRVRKRSFILGTLLLPVGFALFFVVILFLSKLGEEKKVVAVVDQSGYFKRPFSDAKDGSLYFKYPGTTDDQAEIDALLDQYDGVLLIPKNLALNHPSGIKYISDRQMGLMAKSFIEKKIAEEIRDIKIDKYQLDKEVLAGLKVSVDISAVTRSAGEETRAHTGLATALGYIMGFIIYIVLFVYGAMVMRGVMEEKSNRIVEVIVSSVRPFQLMMGKIIGIGAVGLTQFLLWFILIGGVNFVFAGLFSADMSAMNELAMNPEMAAGSEGVDVALIMNNISEIDFGPIILGMLFFFFGGYLLYGALFAAIGSASGDDSDVQSMTFPVSLPIIVSIIIMMFVITQPDSQLAVWSSIIPLSSPIIMPARIPFGVPAWQMALSIISLLTGFLATTWLAAKIYRTGILMYGKKISLRELGKWVFYSG